MDTNNYVLTALPSYVRYSRREIGKASKEDRRNSAFSGIRQKLSSAVISVPYGGGLDNLRLIGNLDDHEFQNRFTSYSKPKRRKSRSTNVSESETIVSDGDMSPIKTHQKYNDQFSPTKLQFSGKKPARIGSETSTTSTATSKSRSTIYSTSENDDGYWAQKLKELDKVKERYSEDSDFLTSLNGYKQKKDKHKSKEKRKNRKQKEKIEVKSDDESTPQPMVDDITKRLILPPIKHTSFDNRKSRESTLTNASDESNTSTIIADEENEISKRRKVEFNFQKGRRTIKLPPLEAKQELHDSRKVKNPKRSILKKIEKNSDTVVNSFPSTVNASPSLWQTQVGKLKSPVPIPSSASRRHQVTFKRSPFNLKYKCSKEFETVASNYESEKKSASFLTE